MLIQHTVYESSHENVSCVKGKRNVKGIIQWLQRRLGPSATLLKDHRVAQELLDAHDVVVVGFFKVHFV